jgi:hypothetical protein
VTPTKQRVRPDILQEVLIWRREQLERAGYTPELAADLAQSDADLHTAMGLLQQGCSPQLAAQILL